MSSQASMMGRLEARGFQYTDEQEIHRRLQAVSAQEVQAAARMLTDERMSTVIIEPQNLPPRQAKSCQTPINIRPSESPYLSDGLNQQKATT